MMQVVEVVLVHIGQGQLPFLDHHQQQFKLVGVGVV